MDASVQGNTRRRKCSMSHAKAERCALGQPACQRAALNPQTTSRRHVTCRQAHVSAQTAAGAPSCKVTGIGACHLWVKLVRLKRSVKP